MPDYQVHHHTMTVRTPGKGTHQITSELETLLHESGLTRGTLTVFCQHTSCSMVIMENADPSARQDLHAFMDRLVPEDEPYFVHTHEGPDDMPSHIKMALTRTSETIPFDQGQLLLGTWQGVYLWEHRAMPHNRRLTVTIQGMG